MNVDDAKIYKWMVIENLATLAATALVVTAGYYFNLGSFALFGLLILLNINAISKSEKS